VADITVRAPEELVGHLPPYEPYWQRLICPMCNREVAKVEVPPGYRSANRTTQRMWQHHLDTEHAQDQKNGKASLSRRDLRRQEESVRLAEGWARSGPSRIHLP
jgi:hypothetical protein